MKLHNRTLIYLSGALLLVLTAWAAILYIRIIDEVHASIDEGLDNSKLLVMFETERDTSVLRQRTFDEGNYAIRELPKQIAVQRRDVYTDTSMYLESEQEKEPVRLLTTAFRRSDGRYYELKVIASMEEEDDLIESLFYSLLWLYLALVMSILLINNFLLRRIWRPFYSLLTKLRQFRLGSQEQLAPEPTRIAEFQLLNETIQQVLQSTIAVFNNQKQLIENAAHELQTPLAIALNKLQLYAEKYDVNEQQAEEISHIIQTLERLTRLNKSLLLLSKIDNRQFPETEIVDFNELCLGLLEDFSDMAAHKGITVSVQEEGKFTCGMHPDLAVILLTNLIKNALVHNVRDGEVRIIITPSELLIENTGQPVTLDGERVFSRFYKGTADRASTGLGLAIVQAICQLSGLEVQYSYTGMHVFRLSGSQQKTVG